MVQVPLEERLRARLQAKEEEVSTLNHVIQKQGRSLQKFSQSSLDEALKRKVSALTDTKNGYKKHAIRLKLQMNSSPPMPQGLDPESGNQRIFFEETSLVGRDDKRLSFAECTAKSLPTVDAVFEAACAQVMAIYDADPEQFTTDAQLASLRILPITQRRLPCVERRFAYERPGRLVRAVGQHPAVKSFAEHDVVLGVVVIGEEFVLGVSKATHGDQFTAT